eukprot:3003521-Rhodomonas_salina.1
MREFFTVSDDGKLQWYLGVRFDKTEDSYHTVQTPYIDNLRQNSDWSKPTTRTFLWIPTSPSTSPTSLRPKRPIRRTSRYSGSWWDLWDGS